MRISIIMRLGFIEILSIASPQALASDMIDQDQFGLQTKCSTVGIHITMNELAKEHFSEEDIMATARSRLRSSRLYREHDTLREPYLQIYTFVDVREAIQIFGVSVSFHKWLYDPASDQHSLVRTWHKRRLGAGARGRGNLATLTLPLTATFIDMFIDDYLRINEESCQ